jgi:AraC-like DNA-binding protein
VSTYRELPPPAVLSDWVTCGWVSTRPGGARILPDGCVDIVWTGRRLIVAGPATEPHLSSDAPGLPKVGVRFRVGAAGAALGMPACEFLDQNPAADDVLGAEVADRVESVGDDPGRVLMELTAAVSERLRQAPHADSLVRAAAIDLAAPGARVRDVADGLGLSERQLRRRFEAAVGYGPKVLARVLRLQRFLTLSSDGGAAAGLSRLAFDAGYSDQAHLTRECSALTGGTPTELLAERRGPAGDAELRALT